jgi:hypothetical protein
MSWIRLAAMAREEQPRTNFTVLGPLSHVVRPPAGGPERRPGSAVGLGHMGNVENEQRFDIVGMQPFQLDARALVAEHFAPGAYPKR